MKALLGLQDLLLCTFLGMNEHHTSSASCYSILHK